LLEPLRTNLITQSEALSIGTSGSTTEQNTADTTSPEGYYNATKILGSASYLAKGVGSAFSGNNTTSVFLKHGNDSEIGVYMYDGAYYRVIFDITDGTISSTFGGATGTITDYGNGWYRCTIYKSTPANVVEVGVDGLAGYVYTYGWQHEYNATYATSYIPTYGSSVTRVVDSCLGAGNANTLNSTEGVLYTELSRFASSGVVDYCSIGISDGTNNNQVVFKFRNSINTFYTTIQSSNGNTRTDLSHTFSDLSETTKIALKYKVNDFALWVNGVEVRTSNNANTPIGMDTFNFASATLSEPFYGNVNQILIFNTSLSDSELADLTTI
jgi:hypothetical protein